ncbi:peptidase M17, leucyl aminopeptidase, partial [Neoconidiobolus thromboides FSU 785]
DWATGEVFANAQNLARYWMDSPANLATPTIIAEHIQKLASKIDNLEIHVRDQEWIKEKKMGAFLSVSKGSDEEPKIVEFHYNGGNANDKPLSFVGKGNYIYGGISIKPSSNMHAMKGDMGGAATVAASVLAIAQLKLPINVRAAIALAENMPSARATKPGDVVTAMNGKTIEVLNTDAEGRMVLSDTLYHVNSTYNPHTVFTVATLTGAIVVALGDPYTGAYASRHSLWQELEQASNTSGDLFWRMPFHPYYKSLMTGTNVADLQNIGAKNGGGSCSAAAFLREFVHLDKEVKEPVDWNDDDTLPTRYGHLDIAAVMEATSDSGYHTKGMTGRPTRTLIEYARLVSKKKF